MKIKPISGALSVAILLTAVSIALPAQTRTQPASAAYSADKEQPADVPSATPATDTQAPTNKPVESNPTAPTSGAIQPEPKADPYPNCPHRYYLTLQFGDDFAFSPRDDRNQADQIGYKCPDGSWHFVFIGVPQ